jgi:hypothetical protein
MHLICIAPQALRRGLDVWRVYLADRAQRRGLRERAVKHWLHGTAGRALAGWRDYQRLLREAEEVWGGRGGGAAVAAAARR